MVEEIVESSNTRLRDPKKPDNAGPSSTSEGAHPLRVEKVDYMH